MIQKRFTPSWTFLSLILTSDQLQCTKWQFPYIFGRTKNAAVMLCGVYLRNVNKHVYCRITSSGEVYIFTPRQSHTKHGIDTKVTEHRKWHTQIDEDRSWGRGHSLAGQVVIPKQKIKGFLHWYGDHNKSHKIMGKTEEKQCLGSILSDGQCQRYDIRVCVCSWPMSMKRVVLLNKYL